MFQPGTSTDFVGSAYGSKSGGSPVSNGFITNAQGEAEAWFDTSQSVDVQVTSNGGTAYYPSAPSTPLVFGSFTEGGLDIGPAREDHPTAVGVAGDLVAAVVNDFTAQTAVAGSTGRFADAAHAHPYSAQTPAAAGYGATAGAAGTATTSARSDHAHQLYVGSTKPSLSAQFTLSNTTTETVIATLSVPGNSLAVGSTFLIKAPGYITNGATSRVLEYRVRWGGIAGTVIGAVNSLTGTTTVHTDAPHGEEAVITFRSVGASGSAVCDQKAVTTFTTTSVIIPDMRQSAKTAATGSLDTTVAKDLVLTAAWTTAAADVTLTHDAIFIQQVV